MYSVWYIRKNEYKSMDDEQLKQEFPFLDFDILSRFDVSEITLNSFTLGNVIISKVEEG